MDKKSESVLCPVCDQGIGQEVKKNFFTGAKIYHCLNCQYEGPLPLAVSMNIFWSTVSLITMYVVVSMIVVGKGSIGWLGLVGPLMLISDFANGKKIKALRKLPNNPVDHKKEINEVNKGILYSVLITALVFILGKVLNY